MIAVVAGLLFSLTSWGYGPWLKKTPLGGVTLGEGDDAAALEKAIAAIDAGFWSIYRSGRIVRLGVPTDLNQLCKTAENVKQQSEVSQKQKTN